MRELFPNLPRILFAVTIFTIMLALGLTAVSCGKSGKSLVSHVNPTNTDSAIDGARSDGDRVTMSVAGPLGGEFVFEPLDGDGTPDKKGEAAYQLKLKPGDGEGGSGSGGGDFGTRPTIELTITAKKDKGYSWKYALGLIEYDAAKYNPVKFIPGDLFGDDEKDVLNAALFQEKGRIAFWCGLKNFDKKDAKPGGDIGTFIIELVPWEPPRDARRAPDDAHDAVFWFNQKLPILDHKRMVYWSEVNRGDGDVSGEVYISDLTPLAQYHEELVINNPLLDVVDYNDDGEIDCTFQGPDYNVWFGSATNIENIAGYKVVLQSISGSVGDLLFLISGPPTTGQRRADIRDQQAADNPENYTDQTQTCFFKAENGAVGYWWNFSNPNTTDYYGHKIYQGGYYVTLTPYDNEFNVNNPEDPDNEEHLGKPSDWFWIGVVGDDPPAKPEARLTVDPPESPELPNHAESSASPFVVTFDASESDDSDGEIERVVWQFDSTHTVEGDPEDLVEEFSYIFSNYNPGHEAPHTIEITACVTIIDDTNMTDTAYAYITLNRNVPPFAYLEPETASGDAPFSVVFDASESFEPNTDDSIVSFEWDWDGDDVFDFNSGTQSIVNHVFEDTGPFMPTVKVIDTRGAAGYQISEVHATPFDALADRIYLDSALPNFIQSGESIIVNYFIEEISRPFFSFSIAYFVNVRDVNQTGVVGTITNQFDFSNIGFLTSLFPKNGTALLNQMDRGNGLRELQILTQYTTPIYHPVRPGTTARVGTISIQTRLGYSGLVEVRIPSDPASGYVYHTRPETRRKYFDNPDYTALMFNVVQ